MRPATGWMAYAHGDSARLQQLGQLAYGVLRLGCGQAVAGDEDDAVGKRKLHGRVVQRDLAHHTAGVGRGRGDHRSEPAEEHIGDGAVHGLAHQHREDKSGEAVQRPGDDEDVIAQHKSCGRGGKARVGVQQRHDDRHVCRADGDHQHHAKDEGHAQHGVEGRDDGGVHPEVEKAARHDEEDDQVDGVLAAELDGLARDGAVQLARGDQRSSGGKRAQHDFEAKCSPRDDAHLGAVDDELSDADQRRGQRSKGVGESVR